MSLKAMSRDEWPSLRVSTRAVTGNPYGYPRPTSFVELRIGRTKRARIIRLEPDAARRLAYRLIEDAAKVEVNQERVQAFDKGIAQGLRDQRRSTRPRKRRAR
ncbi:MAG: hypothetical protein ACRD1S_07805 [Vicinamibacterales bacterium]